MSKAKEITHWGAECVAASDTLETAARMMRDGHVGSLPICGPDNRLQGIITDRNIVVTCLAEGRDPKTTTASDLAQGKPVWVDADDSEVLRLMEELGRSRYGPQAVRRTVFNASALSGDCPHLPAIQAVPGPALAV